MIHNFPSLLSLQLSGENGAYELAIEDMDHRNKDLEEELTRLKVRVCVFI